MHTRNRPLKLCRWVIPNDVHRPSTGFRHRMFKSTIIYWDGTYRSQNYDRKNRAGSRHWLAAIGRACGSSGNIWERDTIWELTKTVIFLEGVVSKWERASHSGGNGDYVLDCWRKEVLTVSLYTWYTYCCTTCHQHHVRDHAPEYSWVFHFAFCPGTLHIGPEEEKESRPPDYLIYCIAVKFKKFNSKQFELRKVLIYLLLYVTSSMATEKGRTGITNILRRQLSWIIILLLRFYTGKSSNLLGFNSMDERSSN